MPLLLSLKLLLLLLNSTSYLHTSPPPLLPGKEKCKYLQSLVFETVTYSGTTVTTQFQFDIITVILITLTRQDQQLWRINAHFHVHFECANFE